MSGRASHPADNNYHRFIAEIRKVGFINVLAAVGSVEEFAALAIVVNILERELIRHEVTWRPAHPDAAEPKISGDIFVIAIEKAAEIKRGVLICDAKSLKSRPQGVLVLFEESLMATMYTLCRKTGHLGVENLWALCIGVCGNRGRYSLFEWNEVIREAELSEETSGEQEGESEEGRRPPREPMHSQEELFGRIKADIARLKSKQAMEHRAIEARSEVYFPFVSKLRFYDAIFADVGVAGELGLFRAKGKKEPEAELKLNQFLAKVGISIAAAKHSSFSNFSLATKKTVKCNFSPRTLFLRNYEYNVKITNIEAFFSVASLVGQGKYANALFALRNMKHADALQGAQAYLWIAALAKKAFLSRKVVKHRGGKPAEAGRIVVVPKAVLAFKTADCMMLARELFIKVSRLLCIHNRGKRARQGDRLILVALLEDAKQYVVLYRDMHSDWKINCTFASEAALPQRTQEAAALLAMAR